MEGYIDLFVLAVPKKRLKDYCRMSTKWGRIMREHGALEYREFVGDALAAKNGTRSFLDSVKLKKGEVVVSAVIGYKSKAHRESVQKKSQKDPRSKKIMADMMGDMYVDMKRMMVGGFRTVVKP